MVMKIDLIKYIYLAMILFGGEKNRHKAFHYSSNNPINYIKLVSKNNFPFINVITWNHMLC